MFRAKDPERVRLGRLGALTVHARGRTNTAPAREAWVAKLQAEIDPDGSLTPDEIARRMQFAMRARMTRLAMARWGPSSQRRAAARKEAAPDVETGAAESEVRRAGDERSAA
jgi:hypothetical protein